MSPLLEVSNLNLQFQLHNGVAHILRDISLSIERAERVAIVGESGCGKSLTVRAILGLIRQKSARLQGSIRLDGTELLSLKPAEWRAIRGKRVSMVFQDPMTALNPVFAIENQVVEVILRGGGAGSRKKARALARDLLEQVAVADPDRVLHAYPFQLSGGLAQRVLISMALANRPEIVLADEPGSALDVTVQEQTLQLMRDLTDEAGAAVLLITHNLGVVREFAHRVYVMYAGTIVEEADVETLFSNPVHPYTRALLEAVPKLTGDSLPQPIEGMVPDYVAAPAGCRFSPRCALARLDCANPPAMIDLGRGHRVACILAGADEDRRERAP